MGLDICVMPLYQGFGWVDGTFDPKKGKAELREFQEMLAQDHGIQANWRDEGKYFSERFSYESFGLLRNFAAHQDYPLRSELTRQPLPFDPKNYEAYGPALGGIWNGASSRFRHLIIHSDNCGFYLPVDFANPALVDEERALCVGSTPRLLRELAMLRLDLGIPSKRWQDFTMEDCTPTTARPYAQLHFALAFMEMVAQLSMKRGLPIVFAG